MTYDTSVSEAPPGVEAPSRRTERHDARRVLWAESSLPRLRECGRAAVGVGGVGVRVSGHVGAGRCAGFSGLSTCSSTWACPVCAAKIAATRQAEIAEAVRRWQAQGHSVLMVTLTMRHKRGQGLKTLWDACSYAWGSATSGAAWRDEKDRYGVRGWLRLVEVTIGPNGWHVHVHALLFVDATSRWAPTDLGPLMYQRWRSALMRKDLDSPTLDHGLNVKVLGGDAAAALGDYFTKSTYAYDPGSAARAGLEIARGDLKRGRGNDNRTPFQVLSDIVRLGEVRDLALWHEWEAGSHGRRQLTWSRGLRAELLADVAELTDSEIVEADEGGDLVLVIDAASWAQLVARPGAPVQVLELAESDATGDNLRAWLRARGFGWQEAEPWRAQEALKRATAKARG